MPPNFGERERGGGEVSHASKSPGEIQSQRGFQGECCLPLQRWVSQFGRGEMTNDSEKYRYNVLPQPIYNLLQIQVAVIICLLSAEGEGEVDRERFVVIVDQLSADFPNRWMRHLRH